MAGAEELTATIRQEIEAQNRIFEAQFATRDASAMAGFYTEHTIVIPPQAEAMALIGQEAVLGWFSGAFDMGLGWIELETQDITLVTDAIVIEIGRYRIGPAPGEVGDTGAYTVTWIRGTDGWKIQRDVITSALLPIVSRDLAREGSSG